MSGPTMVLIGAVTAATLSAVALFIPEDKKLLGRILGIFAFLGAVISAYGGLLVSHESDAMQAKLYEKSEELSGLNREMLWTVTGGGSFCYVQPAIARDGKSAALVLWHRGKYPVSDAQIRVTDLSWPAPPVTPLGSIHWEDLSLEMKIVP